MKFRFMQTSNTDIEPNQESENKINYVKVVIDGLTIIGLLLWIRWLWNTGNAKNN